jgi:hypothetical protein
VQRECKDCPKSHKNIFYKRIANFDKFDAYGQFIESWTSRYNRLNKDFKLYSTLEDALADKNPWRYCNYNDWVGFPRDCGPTRKTNWSWNGILRGQVRGQKNYQYSFFKPIKCPAGTSVNADGKTCSVDKCQEDQYLYYPKTCKSCKVNDRQAPFRCETCPRGYTQDPSDPKACVAKVQLR